jgi:hypothetical protein
MEPMDAPERNAHIALFVDFDNAQLRAMEMGLTHCRNSQLWVSPLVGEVEREMQGSVDIRRCYGNTMLNSGWALAGRTHNPRELRDHIGADVDLQMDLLNNGFQMIHTPSASGKNRADILMALDCMEIAAKYEQIDSFAILSHDSDFSPLIHRLRALGKKVAWVTVGENRGHSRGERSLESMATHRVVYSQQVIDAAGGEILLATLEELQREEPSPLADGVALPSVLARMRKLQPGFAYEDVGFYRFKEFIEACIEEPFVLRGDKVTCPAPVSRTLMPPPLPLERTVPEAGTGLPDAPLAADGVPAAPPAGDGVLQVPPPMDREREFNSLLSRLSLRPMPALRRQVTSYLWDKVFDESGAPREPELVIGKLQDLVEDQFFPQGVGKNKLREVLKLYWITGILEIDRSTGRPFKEAPVLRLAKPEEFRKELVVTVVQRLQSGGITLIASDVAPLSRVIFDSEDEEYQLAVSAGIEAASSRPEQ